VNELLTSTESGSVSIPILIEWTLIFAGFVAAFFLALHHRNNPPDRRTLTAQLSACSWNTKQLGMVVGTLFLLYVLASFSGRLFHEEHIPHAQLVITLAIYTIILILIYFINRHRGGKWESDCGMGAGRLKKIWLAPIFYLAMLPFLLLVTKAYHLLLQQVFGMEIELQDVAQAIQQEQSWLQILYIFSALCIAPIYEELVFRGLLFPYLVKRGGLATGTVLVSAIFAAMHYHEPALLPLFLLSAALCLAYWRTGSLWVCIGMHMIFNAVSVFALNVSG
jgi:membrane protease YdiL (CAAX protease family)